MNPENVSNKILAHYSNVIICFDVKTEDNSYKIYYSKVIICFDVKTENVSYKMLAHYSYVIFFFFLM